MGIKVLGVDAVVKELERLAETVRVPTVALVVPLLQFKILGWLSHGTRGGIERSTLMDITPVLARNMAEAIDDGLTAVRKGAPKDTPWISVANLYRLAVVMRIPNIPHATKKKSSGKLEQALRVAKVKITRASGRVTKG